MPPEVNKNNTPPSLGSFNVGIDPVFKGNPNLQKKIPNENTQISAFGVLSNQKYTPNTPPISQVSTPKPIEGINTAPKSLVRTYKGDLESAIEKDHLSSINIAIAENQKMYGEINKGVTIAETTTSNYS